MQDSVQIMPIIDSDLLSILGFTDFIWLSGFFLQSIGWTGFCAARRRWFSGLQQLESFGAWRVSKHCRPPAQLRRRIRGLFLVRSLPAFQLTRSQGKQSVSAKVQNHFQIYFSIEKIFGLTLTFQKSCYTSFGGEKRNHSFTDLISTIFRITKSWVEIESFSQSWHDFHFLGKVNIRAKYKD